MQTRSTTTLLLPNQLGSDSPDKKAYLQLLPPSQIIEICLTFEAYAPPHIRSLVWPVDLNAAIATLQEQRDKSCATPSNSETPPMDSLFATRQSAPGFNASLQPSSSAPILPNGEPSTTATTTKPSERTATQSEGSSSSATNVQPLHPQPPYPHRQFPNTQPAYPHTPYYSPQPPPGYPPYPPLLHPQLHAPYPPPHPPPNAFFQNASFPHPQDSSQIPIDDLPSYEEMIVEALRDFGDPEGAPPKDLFSWMASHYPLQTNFRPSASQALQKAFKRGRLEKTSSGKYRLNPSWEGGNTSRRTTRRPQTHSQTTLVTQQHQHGQNPPIQSPFTHMPLHRQLLPALSDHSAPGEAQYPVSYYPHPYPPPGYPGYPSHPVYPPDTTGGQGSDDFGEGSDAWKAAHNILKAINFGGLTQLPSHDEPGGRVNAVPASAVPNLAGHHPVSTETRIPSSAGSSGAMVSSKLGEGRAELQAQLALLSVQLMEITQASDNSVVSQARTEELQAGKQDKDADESDDDDMDMVEVTVPVVTPS